MLIKRFITILFILSACIPLFSKDLELTTKIKGLEVKITLDKNPPILGDNKIEIEILDASGDMVTDANVLVNYYMPPMPRMAPMNYKTKTELKKNKYTAEMDFIMEGPWILAIKISFKGDRMTARFNVDAR